MKIWSHNESAKQIQLAYWTLVLNSQRNGSTLTLHSLTLRHSTYIYTFSHFTLVSSIHMVVAATLYQAMRVKSRMSQI